MKFEDAVVLLIWTMDVGHTRVLKFSILREDAFVGQLKSLLNCLY